MSGISKAKSKELVPNFLHNEENCRGSLELVFKDQFRMGLTGLGEIILSKAPFVNCKNCGAAYLPEGLDLLVEQAFAKWLIQRNRQLLPQELRFLRVVLGLNQEEMAQRIEADRTYLSKCESPSHAKSMGFDKQIRLRLIVAKELARNKQEFASIVDKIASLKDIEEAVIDYSGVAAPDEVQDEVQRVV